MPRPGFYNDNEYRAYPFIYAAPQPLPAATLPTSLIVDAGIVMGLDADFDAAVHSVWLASVQLTGGVLRFTLATDAPGALSAALIFSRDPSGMWETEFVESGTAVATAPCATEPIWEGFLTTGTLTDFVAGLSGTAITFTKNQYQLEPARIQNLAKSYLRSISVGNFSRTNVPPCNEVNTTERPVVLNARCIQGDIRFKEGYNCLITQTDRANELIVSAIKGAGAGSNGDELCANSGELPFFDDDGGATKTVPIQYIGTLDAPDSSTLPGCSGAKPGDTYGWESEPTPASPNCAPLPPQLCQHKNAIYYTWNNKTWVQTNAALNYLWYGPPPVGVPAEGWPASRWETLEEKMPTEIMWVDKFLSGGPACCELISTINGLGGRVVSITGGTGVQVSTATDKITIALDTNSQNNCAPN